MRALACVITLTSSSVGVSDHLLVGRILEPYSSFLSGYGFSVEVICQRLSNPKESFAIAPTREVDLNLKHIRQAILSCYQVFDESLDRYAKVIYDEFNGITVVVGVD